MSRAISRALLLKYKRTMLMNECALQRTTLIAQTQSFKQATSWKKASGDMSGNLIDRFSGIPRWVNLLLLGLTTFTLNHPTSRAAVFAKKGLVLWQFWQTFSSKIKAK